jgi:nitrogen regulatory protein PII
MEQIEAKGKIFIIPVEKTVRAYSRETGMGLFDV